MRVPKGPRASSFSAATTLFAIGLSLAVLVACSKPAQSSTITPPKLVPTAMCPAPHAMTVSVNVALDAGHYPKANPKDVEVPSCTIAKFVLAMSPGNTGDQITGVAACKSVGAFSVQVSSGKATIIDRNTDPKAKGKWEYRITVQDKRGNRHITKDPCSQDPPPSIHNQ